MEVAGLEMGGGPQQGKMDLHEKVRAAADIVAGAGLITLPFWSHLADNITLGAHVIAAVCGALIGLHGVRRIYFPKKRTTTTDSMA